MVVPNIEADEMNVDQIESAPELRSSAITFSQTQSLTSMIRSSEISNCKAIAVRAISKCNDLQELARWEVMVHQVMHHLRGKIVCQSC